MESKTELAEPIELSGGDEVEIDLADLYYLLRQNLVWILLALVLGGVLAGGFTYLFITPKYQATAKLYIVSASNDSVVNLSDLQIGSSLTADYSQLVLSRPMLESVINDLELDMDDIGTLSRMVSVTNPSNTRILNITVTDTDPLMSMKIANEIAYLAMEWLPEVMQSHAPTLAEEAVIPLSPSSPNLVRNALIGAVAFAALYYGFCVIRYFMDDSIRTSEDFERYFGFVPLTAIPEEKIEDHEKEGMQTHGRRRGGRREKS